MLKPFCDYCGKEIFPGEQLRHCTDEKKGIKISVKAYDNTGNSTDVNNIADLHHSCAIAILQQAETSKLNPLP